MGSGYAMSVGFACLQDEEAVVVEVDAVLLQELRDLREAALLAVDKVVGAVVTVGCPGYHDLGAGHNLVVVAVLRGAGAGQELSGAALLALVGPRRAVESPVGAAWRQKGTHQVDDLVKDDRHLGRFQVAVVGGVVDELRDFVEAQLRVGGGGDVVGGGE